MIADGHQLLFVTLIDGPAKAGRDKFDWIKLFFDFVFAAVSAYVAYSVYRYTQREAEERAVVNLEATITGELRGLRAGPNGASLSLLELALTVKNISADGIGLLAVYVWTEGLSRGRLDSFLANDDFALLDAADQPASLAVRNLLRTDSLYYLQPGESERFIWRYVLNDAFVERVPCVITRADLYCVNHDVVGVGHDHMARRRRVGLAVTPTLQRWLGDALIPDWLRRWGTRQFQVGEDWLRFISSQEPDESLRLIQAALEADEGELEQLLARYGEQHGSDMRCFRRLFESTHHFGRERLLFLESEQTTPFAERGRVQPRLHGLRRNRAGRVPLSTSAAPAHH